jgi:hypothetical protein
MACLPVGGWLRYILLLAVFVWTVGLLATFREGARLSAGEEPLLERQKRIELEQEIEELVTKQQDLQSQLDILRQQMPLPEEMAGGEKPPTIEYTKWGKNFYNTRRDDDTPASRSGKGDEAARGDGEEGGGEGGGKVRGNENRMEARKNAVGVQTSSNDLCVFPKALDYNADFWGGKAFSKCCKGAACDQTYELRSKGTLLVSHCKTSAVVKWDKEERTVEPGSVFELANIPDVGSRQYVQFVCNDNELIVPVPLKNEKAYQNALALNPGKKPNVVVLMIDALSRAQFIRALPKTMAMFKSIGEDAANKFSVFDFEFYGILGAYSPPNRYAFFSGYPLSDDQAFFPGSPFPIEEKKLRAFEKKGVWMWDIFGENGYMTYSARDMCSTMSMYLYDDYVSRPWTHVHFQDVFCHNKYSSHASSSEHCFKNRYAHRHIMDSGMLFYEAYDDMPRYVFLDFAEGHEPSMTVVRTMDDDLVEFLPQFLADENTVVVVASDHGIGYGKQHVTASGPLEERLPALFLVTPNRLLSKEEFSHATENTQKLATPLDTFETLIDLALRKKLRPWTYSLIRPMPSRNCKEAGINIHACPCTLWDGQQKSRVGW